MLQHSRAWLLTAGVDFAVAERHMVEYLTSPQIINVPLRPPHCAGVTIWREHWIPVLDFIDLAQANPPPAAAGALVHVVVLAYQFAPGEALHHGALVVRAPPREALVSDAMACPLPDDLGALQRWACACFSLEGKAIPIVDVTRLFSGISEVLPFPIQSDTSLPHLAVPHALSAAGRLVSL